MVVAGLADVRVGAWAGGLVPGAVSWATRVLSISLFSQLTLSGMIGLPAGVRVNWRRILPESPGVRAYRCASRWPEESFSLIHGTCAAVPGPVSRGGEFTPVAVTR
jgi:hypothetical protein